MVGLRTVLRNLMLVANASSAVVGFAVLGLAAALHVGERPEAHVAAGGRTLTLIPTLTLTLTLPLPLTCRCGICGFKPTNDRLRLGLGLG